jgi:hypothetical protein
LTGGSSAANGYFGASDYLGNDLTRFCAIPGRLDISSITAPLNLWALTDLFSLQMLSPPQGLL